MTVLTTWWSAVSRCQCKSSSPAVTLPAYIVMQHYKTDLNIGTYVWCKSVKLSWARYLAIFWFLPLCGRCCACRPVHIWPWSVLCILLQYLQVMQHLQVTGASIFCGIPFLQTCFVMEQDTVLVMQWYRQCCWIAPSGLLHDLWLRVWIWQAYVCVN